MPSFTSFLSIVALTSGALGAVLLPRGDAATGVKHSGDITWYNTLGGDGACGSALSDDMKVCALSTELYDQFTKNGNPNDNSLCGKQIKVTMSDGSTETVTVADRCAGCAKWDIDLTPTVFDSIVSGGAAVGRTTASWHFV